MSTEWMTNPSYDIPPLNPERPDSQRLNQLFKEEDGQDDVDFQYNLSNDKPAPKPPRRASGQQNVQPFPQKLPVVVSEPTIVQLTSDSCAIEFEEGIRMCYVSVVNAEVIRFDNVVDGSLLLSAPVSSSMLSASGNATVWLVNGKKFCSFVGNELSAKLLAVFSAKKFTDPLIFSEGDGEKEVSENYKILYSQLCFQFSNNQLKAVVDSGKNEHAVYMKNEKLVDPFLKHFLRKKVGAKFVIGHNGIGSLFELRKARKKSKTALVATDSPNSEASEPTTPDIGKRMSKLGVKLPMADQIVNHPLQKHDTSELDVKSVEIYDLPPYEAEFQGDRTNDNTSSSPEPDASKPVPATRTRSTSSVPSVCTSSLEKRVEAIEKKLSDLSLSEHLEGAGNNLDKCSFAMDVWAKIVKSESIPESCKKEIKKILLSTAAEV